MNDRREVDAHGGYDKEALRRGGRMQQDWCYDRSRKWEPIVDPFPEEWSDFDEALHSIGFSSCALTSVGDPNGFSVDVHEVLWNTVLVEAVESNNTAGGRREATFLAVVNTMSHVFAVFITDLPSLMRFLHDVPPLLVGMRENEGEAV